MAGVSEKQAQSPSRAQPAGEEFREFVASGWAPRRSSAPPLSEAARSAAPRRQALSQAFPGERLVVPAGGLKVRSNDCDYVFRPHSAFAYLTGLGADREPDAVLVLEPSADGGHEAVLFFRPLAGRETEEFFGDSRYGEFWVGARPSLADVESELGLTARHIDDFTDAVSKDAGSTPVRLVRDADRDLTGSLDDVRRSSAQADRDHGRDRLQDQDQDHEAAFVEADEELAHHLSLARMVKDEWEIDQMRRAVSATAVGFEAVVASLPDAVAHGHGERWVEGVFGLHARHQGNGVGYDSICAGGDHANTLHWVKNTGELRADELLLLDAGVEVDSLFTADVTRTLPVGGLFTDAQRRVYDAVYAAQSAGIAAVRPGARFSDVHAAAIRVIAEHLYDWGLLPDGVDVEATLDKEHGLYHRRWMVHGTSHHLGLDVHDCALARREEYSEALLEPGMVLTVEPGLYFKADDLLVPSELRGIGVRIEDDVVVTADGCENLSDLLPRSSADVEAWIARVQSAPTS